MTYTQPMQPREKPDCPRCGYDLSAMPPSWKESCPLEGVCSECGLEFAWGEVFDEESVAPEWLIESNGALARPVGVLALLRKMAFPFKFWSEIGLHAPFRPLRIAALILFFFLVTYTICIGFGLVQSQLQKFPVADVTGAISIQWSRFFSTWGSSYNRVSWPPLGRVYDLELKPLVLWFLIAPVPLLALYASRRVERFKWRHVLRAWGYSMLFVCALACVLLVRQSAMQLLGPAGAMRVGWIPQNGLVRVLLWDDPSWHKGKITVLCAVWLVLFWWAFFWKYLKLKHPIYVAGSMLLISLLVTAYLTYEIILGWLEWWSFR